MTDPIAIGHAAGDDAIRAVDLYCRLVADAVLSGIQQEVLASGADVGEAEEAPVEPLPAEPEPEAAAPAAEGTPEAAPAEQTDAATTEAQAAPAEEEAAPTALPAAAQIA